MASPRFPLQQDASNRKLILVVDDNHEFLALMQEVLETEGYAARTCRWAEDTPTRIRNLRPDLLILDVRMQGAKAWTAFDQVNADPELAAIPCIVASAAPDLLQQRQDELTSIGCALIAKPFTLDQLFATIEGLIGPTAAAADGG